MHLNLKALSNKLVLLFNLIDIIYIIHLMSYNSYTTKKIVGNLGIVEI